MIEYTRKDIIMDPNDPRLEGAIGKKVYCSSDICMLLKHANEHKYEMILTRVMEEANVKPFVVTDMDGDEIDADFIIIKKEEEPKYVPFKSADEFIDAYDYTNHSIKNGTAENKLFNYGGIWLRNKNDDSMYMVIEIWNDGVVLGSDQIATPWKYILDEYTFLDGTTCGKEVEE